MSWTIILGGEVADDVVEARNQVNNAGKKSVREWALH